MSHDCSFLRDVLAADQVSFSESDRGNHAGDFGTNPERETTPDAVAYPESTADVAAVLAAADERGVPVTPYAAGTGLEGSATPAHAGVSLDLTRMDDVLAVRPDDLQVDVEPGVIGAAVNEAVGPHGLFFPPLPSSGDISTIGGMIATGASGMQTVKYGEVADWVLELEVVLADGSVITVGSKAVKTSSGYNLRDLIVGSEGTLGVVTRATLELAGRPAQIKGGRVIFETLEDATAAVRDVVTSGVDVAKIELVDPEAAALANDYSGSDLPDAPMAFVEFHGDNGVDEEIDFFEAVVSAHDPVAVEIKDEAAMAELWRVRKDIGHALEVGDSDRDPNRYGDVTVPIGDYPDIVSYVKRRADEENMSVPCFGHAGDGNLHYSVLVDPDDPSEVERGERIYSDVVTYAIDCGGTATGEHGIGQGKQAYLEAEHGTDAVDVMRRVKQTFDPNDTLNPGKIFPETRETGGRVQFDDR